MTKMLDVNQMVKPEMFFLVDTQCQSCNIADLPSIILSLITKDF